MRNISSLGIQIADILLPNRSINLTRWAVIACDQFTSQPDYWQKVDQLVGDAPSTYHMILPEVYLGTPEEVSRLHSTQQKMGEYLANGTLETHEGMIYVERTVDGKTRHGIMLALDLEKYDFSKGSQSLIRATEGTILDRLPPRVKIREGASIELPHIIVLIDDPDNRVFATIEAKSQSLPLLYDFELMQGSGHLRGRAINAPELVREIVDGLTYLSQPEIFQQKYQVGSDKGVLLFAVGDGNHSLATAKSIWEKIKAQVGPDHPARYALVEIENVHDSGLEFAPIHRVLFNNQQNPVEALQEYFGTRFSLSQPLTAEEMRQQVNNSLPTEHCFGLITPQRNFVATVRQPSANLPVGTLQAFLDQWLKSGRAGTIDYVHGDETVCQLGAQPNHLGFYLPGMAKSDLFKTVIVDGVLPRKTFSMGEAHEKRFYMECRRITPSVKEK
jgi:hypothetical protein